jgi:hypothetical protein
MVGGTDMPTLPNLCIRIMEATSATPCDLALRVVGRPTSRYRRVVRLSFDSGHADQSRDRRDGQTAEVAPGSRKLAHRRSGTAIDRGETLSRFSGDP